jgi:hypothetical protein
MGYIGRVRKGPPSHESQRSALAHSHGGGGRLSGRIRHYPRQSAKLDGPPSQHRAYCRRSLPRLAQKEAKCPAAPEVIDASELAAISAKREGMLRGRHVVPQLN